MTRLLTIAAVLSAATTLATGYGSVAYAAPASTEGATGGGLVISPGSALFDVELTQGVPEARELTLTNTGRSDLDVQLSVALSAGAPADHRLEHLRLYATSSYASCDASVLDGAPHLAFAEVQRIDQEAVPAGATRTVCIGVLMPPDLPLMDEATTVVDLRFHSFDAGTTPGGGDDDSLPFTGSDALRLLPTAFLALVTGVLLYWATRRRTDADDADTTQPTSPKASR